MSYPHYSSECSEYHSVVRDFLGPRPRIVCLCGSTRFFEQFQRANYELTMAGNIVLSVGCDTHSDSELKIAPEQKAMLDELHKRKIDLADQVFVLNVGGYIGPSTRSEIKYANQLQKPVIYLEPLEPAPEPLHQFADR